MARSSRLKLYQFVKDVVELGSEVLTVELQVEPDRARQVMILAAKAICFRNARSTVYIPEAVNLANIERNALIWAAYQQPGPAPTFSRPFSPQRATELALEYDLSPQMIYNILAEQRAQEVDARQGSLPGVEPES